MSELVNTSNGVEVKQEPLRDYEQLKFELANLARAVLAALPTPRDAATDREYQSLMSRLAEDQFNLAVVGQFSRGKTSLMNAVLGMDRLPTGIVPLTSVITVVRYGSRETALVEYEDSGLRQEIPLSDLPAYVTQQGNPGNQKRVRTVEVQLPCEILRRGYRFVDTPGLGSAIASNTATTERYLPEADAIVFVTSSDAPLGELEVEYLHRVRRLVRKLFVIINKMDLVSEEDQRQVVDFVRGRLAEEGLAELPVYAVSARDALRAKLGDETSVLQESGFPEFELDLLHFLVTEKSRDFLAQNCDRLMRIAIGCTEAESAGGIADLRARVLGLDRTNAKHDAFELANSRVVRRSCPVCEAAAGAVADFLAKYQYEISYRQEEQRRHAANHGFCSSHTWQYERLASPRGVCSAYPPLLEVIVRELLQVASEPVTLNMIKAGHASRDHCPACQVQRQTVRTALQRLSESIDGSGGVVCLPHLRLLLPLVDGNVAHTLLSRHAQVLQQVAEDMQRFVLKQDGLRRDLMSDEERQSHRQGLALIAGDGRLASTSETEVWVLRDSDSMEQGGRSDGERASVPVPFDLGLKRQ
jgi:GTP-binding protein EngB required for normal cell division